MRHRLRSDNSLHRCNFWATQRGRQQRLSLRVRIDQFMFDRRDQIFQRGRFTRRTNDDELEFVRELAEKPDLICLHRKRTPDRFSSVFTVRLSSAISERCRVAAIFIDFVWLRISFRATLCISSFSALLRSEGICFVALL